MNSNEALHFEGSQLEGHIKGSTDVEGLERTIIALEQAIGYHNREQDFENERFFTDAVICAGKRLKVLKSSHPALRTPALSIGAVYSLGENKYRCLEQSKNGIALFQELNEDGTEYIKPGQGIAKAYTGKHFMWLRLSDMKLVNS